MIRWNDLLKLDVDNVLGTIGLIRSNRNSGVGSFLAGLGVGLIAGGAAALLLTPVNGNEARRQLAKTSEDLTKTLSEKVGELTEKVNTLTGKSDATTGSTYSTSTAGTLGSSTPMTGTSTYGSGTRVGSL